MKSKQLHSSHALAALALALSALSAAAADVPYGYMHYDPALSQRWQAERATSPVYQAPGGYPALPGSVNLLDHMKYDASLRNQGDSGTCWLWGCQAVLSLEYAIQHPEAPLLTNGFSVQFVNSHVGLVDYFMFGGGTPGEFAGFFTAMKFAIPWDNINGRWTDGSGWNKTMAATIHTQPNMPLESVSASSVITFTNSEAVAIANLKSALDAGRPLWFNMTLANGEDWAAFCTFWGKTNAVEETVIDLAFGANHEFDPNSGGSHVVACVGYDDRDADPTKHCWLMLNSWGDGGYGPDGIRRPKGLFRMAMHTQYDARLTSWDTNAVNQMFEWGLLDVTWATKVRKGVSGLALNLPTRDPAASSVSFTKVSFPRTATPTNVYSAHVELNWRDFSCDPTKGNWTRLTNGFHYQSNPGQQPGLQMDIDTNACTWSLVATNLPAEEARYIDPHRGLAFEASCKETPESAGTLDLGGNHLFAFDELESTATGEYVSPPPDAPTLDLRVNGTQGVLRIGGETGRTCAVQETDALGSGWFLRALVPMTQPVEEVTLPAPLGTNRFWRVKVQ
jgi:hypothetical protein